MNKTILLLLLLGACSFVPDYERPVVPTPPAWDNAKAKQGTAVGGAEISPTWWKDFQSAELNALVDKALAQNTDVEASLHRIEQARANVTAVDASFYPNISMSGTGNRSRNESNGVITAGNSGRLQANAGYELDLWGKLRANAESANAKLAGSQFDAESVALVTETDVTTAYINLLGINDRIKVAENNLTNARKVQNIIEARYKEGAVAMIDLAQQKTSTASSEAAIVQLRQQRDAFRTQLAILTGQAPQGFAITGKELSNVKIPDVSPTLPSQLLVRRPDIRLAESNLLAANADIGAARAAFFPTLNLSLSGALLDPAGSALSIGASTLATIFDGGALAAAEDSATARKAELAASYRGTVLGALKEVEDQLSAVNAADQRTDLQAEAAKQSRIAYDIARQRYDVGSSDYQTLLTTQASLFSSEDNLISARLDRMTALVGLIKVMGGGFKQ